MEMELHFVDCLLCDVKFCAVPLTPQSQDESLLDIFCQYFELSPKDVEKVYDERVGFPFCDNCRGVTLCSLSRLHDNLNLIHNEINQLVTNICKFIVNIASENNMSSEPRDSDQENHENYSREAIMDIRQRITSRFNPQVSLVQLDFQRIHRKSKKRKKKKEQRRFGVSLRDAEEFISHMDPSSILGMADGSIVKNEPSSPSFLHQEDGQQGFDFDFKVVQNDQVDSANSSLPSVSRYGRKRKQIMQTKSDSDLELESLSDKEKVEGRRNGKNDESKEDGPSKSKSKSKSNERTKKPVIKNKKVTKKRGRPKPSSPDSDSDPDFNAEAEEAVQLSSSDEDEDNEKGGNDTSKSSKSPVKKGPKKMGRPKKGFELHKADIPKKWKWGDGDPKEREKYLRDKNDPWIEVEPNLFRRKESGWSYRVEPVDGVDVFVCLAEGCGVKLFDRRSITHHVSLMHINNSRVNCPKCDILVWKTQLDNHNCTPITSGFRKTQDFGNGQFIYDEIWPFYKVDKAENGGCDLQCGTCGSLQREQSRMTTHIRIAHVESNFPCEICGKILASKAGLREHVSNVHTNKEVVCDQCGGLFKTQNSLKAHVEAAHERGPKSFKCDFPNCDKAFSRRFALYRHRKTAGHPKRVDLEPPRFLIDPITCPLCTKKFVKEATYNRHRETCRGKKEFLCPICHKNSATRQARRIHMARLHKDEYMNYPEGQLKSDPTKTADEAIAAKNRKSSSQLLRERDKRRAIKLQQKLEELKQLKQNENQPTSSS